MDKLDNIEVFALCVAEIMDKLYTAFPIPTALPESCVAASYEPSQEESQPRIVQPEDPDYESLFSRGRGFGEFAGLAHAAEEWVYEESYGPIFGKPFQYWTDEQRQAIREHRVRARDVERIHKETVRFLVREGYVNDISLPDGEGECHRESLVLTSKGFAHLNKKFEDGTIREEFHFRTVKKLVGAIKAGGEVVSAAQKIGAASGLVHILATFLSGPG